MRAGSAAPVDRQADMLQDILVRLAAIEKLGHVHNPLDDLAKIEAFAWNGLPSTHLECVGGTVLIASYPEYAAKVGTLWGGNGTTTVGIPDLKGRGPIGRGDGDAEGHTNRVLGTKYGYQTHTITAAEAATQVHGHANTIGTTLTDTNHWHDLNNNNSPYADYETIDHAHGGLAGVVQASSTATGLYMTDTGTILLYVQYGNTGGRTAAHYHRLQGTTAWQSTHHTNYQHYHTMSGSVTNHAGAAGSNPMAFQSPATTVVLAIRVRL